MEDNNLQENFEAYVNNEVGYSNEIFFKRSKFYLIYIFTFLIFGLVFFILGIVKGEFGIIFFSMIFLIASIAGLVIYLRIPHIMVHVKGDTVTFYRRKHEPITVRANDIKKFSQYTYRGIGSADFHLTDGTILRYRLIGDLVNCGKEFDAWKSYNLNKQIEQLKAQLPESGCDIDIKNI